MVGIVLWAIPPLNAEYHKIVLVLTVATHFTGRENRVSNNDCALPQLRLVLDKLAQHSETCIRYSTRQSAVLGHTSNVQVLDGDDFEVCSQVITDFVQDCFALVADPIVITSKTSLAKP